MILFTGDYYGIFQSANFLFHTKIFNEKENGVSFTVSPHSKKNNQKAEEVEILQKNNYFLIKFILN